MDYALPKRFEEVPELLNAAPAVKRMRYGHYGCNVIHESLAFAPGVDVKAEKAAIKRRLEALGGVLPAEHGFGTEYAAPADSQKRWKAMDPTNAMNPGPCPCKSHALHASLRTAENQDEHASRRESRMPGCVSRV